MFTGEGRGTGIQDAVDSAGHHTIEKLKRRVRPSSRRFTAGTRRRVPAPARRRCWFRAVWGNYRILYAVESPESWFEDFGFGKLVHGRAHIEIANDFAKFIHARDYHVFLSPEGESKGLYVAKKSASGFDVIEQDGGQSGIRFSYRIVAKRRDLRGRRLEILEPPKIEENFSGRIVQPAVPRSPEKEQKKARRGKG